MPYVGKIVYHKKFGRGVITSSDERGCINVCFDSSGLNKRFVAPSCFKQFLTLEDSAAASEVENDITISENREQIAPEQKNSEDENKSFAARAKKTSSNHCADNLSPNIFKSYDDFLADQSKQLYNEMLYLRNNGGKRTRLFDGYLIELKNSRYVYSFESDSELNLPDNIQISLWLENSLNQSISATIIGCEDFTVVMATTQYLGNYISSAEFTAETWRLLQFLIDRLYELQKNRSDIVDMLVCDGGRSISPMEKIKCGQKSALEKSSSQPITFIWGPPGTGKTETLANIAINHLAKGYRVLMLSYSNVSVDGAILRVFNKAARKTPGTIVRYGYPKDKYLLQHDFLTSYNLALKNHPDLNEKRYKFIEERKKESRSSVRYVEIGRELQKINNEIDTEEKRSVQNASFVGTTVSKAIVDAIIYSDSFDTVIFDEASMAYIAQIIFAAGLANKHFICLGDFKQLPPIVESNDNDKLNVDIFNYCGIASAVNAGYSHKWLCLLDTQYRMHPKIADFSSFEMYHSLLKSSPEMEGKTSSIVEHSPFPGQPMYLVDLSGSMSVCTKTSDKSRINVLSALVSMGIAINAAKYEEVGIVTPYKSQSRLLHSMARDIAEQCPELKKITCATVHQFQGSEKSIIIYDAVDCYRMPYPGTLLTSTKNDLSNRLFNVALTRSKGKFIPVVNVDYMKTKKLSNKLIFRKLIDQLESEKKICCGDSVTVASGNQYIQSFSLECAEDIFLKDIELAKREVLIDMPGGGTGKKSWYEQFAETIKIIKKRGINVVIRTDCLEMISTTISRFVIENKYVTNPVALIDKEIIWFGMPQSNADFVKEGQSIASRFRPIYRYKGKYFAKSLYGFLEMSKTIDSSDRNINNSDGIYNSFASYVAGEIKCSECRGKMRLKKSQKGRFYIACENYPKCNSTKRIDPEMVNKYFYFHNKEGKHCPRDNTSLEARVGKTGLYVCCNSINKHFYKLDQI